MFDLYPRKSIVRVVANADGHCRTQGEYDHQRRVLLNYRTSLVYNSWEAHRQAGHPY